MKLASLLALTTLLFATVSAPAALDLYGSSKFQFGTGNTTVTFGCGGISNPSKENATGTIMVRLWALDAPYKGGTISGKILASYKLDGLNPGAYYSPVSRTVATTLPGTRKAYYLCLTVMEYKANGYVVSDHTNFSGTTVLGPQKLFTLTGPWSWQSHGEGGIIDLAVAKISHTRSSTTGTLELAVWATKAPYKGGGINGFKLGHVKKEALKTGYTYNNVKNTAKYNRPPAGTYHITLVLSEWDGDAYKIVAYLPSSKTSTFK